MPQCYKKTSAPDMSKCVCTCQSIVKTRVLVHNTFFVSAYDQEIGRAGREGNFAQPILYYNNNDLAIQHIRKEVKDYCKSKKCLRELVNEFFGFYTWSKPQSCCSMCHETLGIEWEFGQLTL